MLRRTGTDVGTPISSSTRDESEMEDPEDVSLENDVKVEVKEELNETDDEETETGSQYFDDSLEEPENNEDGIHVDKDQKPDLNNICLGNREQVFGSVASTNSCGRRSARLKRRTNDFGQVAPSQVKRTAKAEKRSSASIPIRGPRQLHCLLCFKTTDENTMKSIPSITEMDFQVMFVLKKMLNIPSNALADYLERFGHPREWVTFCNACIPKVNKAIVIQKEINRLEENLRTCQKELVNTIKKSWKDEQEMSTLSSNHVTRVTIQARNFVLTGKNPSRIRERENSAGRKKKRDRSKQNTSLARRLRLMKALKTKRAQCLLENVTVPLPLPNEEKQTLTSGEIETRTYEENEGMPIKNLNFNLPLPPPVSRPLSSKWKTKMSKWESKIAKITNKSVINKGRHHHRHPKDLSKSKLVKTKPELEDLSTLSNCKYHCVLCPHVNKMNSHVFINHIQFHSRRPFKCSECQTYFAGRNELELESTNELRKETNCHKCSSSTVAEMKFKPDKLWECLYCQERFDFDEERDLHQISVHGEHQKSDIVLNRTCNICQRKFRSVFEWRLHRVLEHPREAALGCFYCDELFPVKTKEGIDLTDMEKLKIHMRDEHNDYGLEHRFVYVCDLCGSNCLSTQLLNDHFENEHKVNKNKSFPCELCCYRTINRCLLLSHQRNIHHSEEANIHVCESCGYKVKSGLKYEVHMWSKHSVEPKDRPLIKCKELGCDFRTVGKNSMDLHMMKEHKAARKHVCKDCGKGFTATNKLQDHEEIHKNKITKPYVCEFCGNSFAVKNYLYIHMRLTHQNRPFASTNKKKPSTSRKQSTPKSSLETATVIPSAVTNELPAAVLPIPNIGLNLSEDV